MPQLDIRQKAERIAALWREGQTDDIVAKPLFGAQGRGLRRIAPGAALPDPAAELSGVLYLQRYVGRQSAWRCVVAQAPLLRKSVPQMVASPPSKARR